MGASKPLAWLRYDSCKKMPYQITIPATEPRRHPTYHLSYKLMPEVWYENVNKLRLIYVVVILILLALFLPRYGYAPPRVWSVIGVLMYVFGWLTDAWSTWLCMRLVPQFKVRDLDYPIVETNPFLSKRPSLSEQIFNVTTLFAIAAATMSWFAPGLGIASGGMQIGVGINNLRQRRRLKLQLSLYDGVEKFRGV